MDAELTILEREGAGAALHQAPVKSAFKDVAYGSVRLSPFTLCAAH